MFTPAAFLVKNPMIAEMAKKYGVSAAQLCIRYVIQLGTVALPKTANPDHMASNADADFEISDKDMDILMHIVQHCPELRAVFIRSRNLLGEDAVNLIIAHDFLLSRCFLMFR